MKLAGDIVTLYRPPVSSFFLFSPPVYDDLETSDRMTIILMRPIKIN